MLERQAEIFWADTHHGDGHKAVEVGQVVGVEEMRLKHMKSLSVADGYYEQRMLSWAITTAFIKQNNFVEFNIRPTDEALEGGGYRRVDAELRPHLSEIAWNDTRSIIASLFDAAELQTATDYREAFIEALGRHVQVMPELYVKSYLTVSESFEEILNGYFEYHKLVLERRLPPRFLIFRLAKQTFGWGNLAHAMCSNLFFAILTRRAFLLDWSGYRMDLSLFFRRPQFEWDYSKVFADSSFAGLQETNCPCQPPKEESGSSKSHSDSDPIIVQCGAETWRTLLDSPIFKASFKPLIGEPPVYTMIGLMMPYLFQPSDRLRAKLAPWEELFHKKQVIGLQLRHSNIKGDDHKITDMSVFELLVNCASGMRQEPSSHIFLVTDEEYGRNVTRRLLGDQVSYVEADMNATAVHIAVTTDVSIWDNVFLDWFLFGWSDDAVLCLGSSFAWYDEQFGVSFVQWQWGTALPPGSMQALGTELSASGRSGNARCANPHSTHCFVQVGLLATLALRSYSRRNTRPQ
jgi:hypothetical protein